MPPMTDRSPFRPDSKDERLRLRDSLVQGLERRGTIAPYEPTVADRIESLGFSGDTARAFDLLPLVLVAWADGSIQAGERAAILDVLRLRRLVDGPAYTMFETLLEERPADVYLETALGLLRDLLDERGIDAASVVDMCIEVAAAASDIVGADPISSEERDAIARVAEILGDSSLAAFRQSLG